jgi:4-oxalocrotonate tautomerase
MPLVQIKVVEGVLTDDEKREMIGKVTDSVLSVYGENLRPHTWVMVEDIANGHWGLGGKGLTTADVQGIRGAVASS